MAKRRGQGEGSITQRTDGTWQAAISLEDGKRKYYYGKTRREVSDKLKKALHDQQEGTLITAKDQPFNTFLTRWFEDVVQPSARQKTVEGYERQIRLHITPSLGKIPLGKLTAQNLQAHYRKQLDKGLAPSSVALQHAVIHKALKQALRWNLVNRNVADLVSAPRAKPQEMHPLTPEQVRTFLDTARDDPFYAVYVLAITSGMRQSELLGLKWADVDLDRATVHVRQQLIYSPKKGFSFAEPKRNSRRSITIPGSAVEALREHRREQIKARLRLGEAWTDLDLVFPREDGNPLARSRLVEWSFAHALKRAGLPHIRFHDLRHTSATLLLTEGAHPRVVQERLGHSSVSITLDVYSHVLPTLQQNAADKLESILGRSAAG